MNPIQTQLPDMVRRRFMQGCWRCGFVVAVIAMQMCGDALGVASEPVVPNAAAHIAAGIAPAEAAMLAVDRHPGVFLRRVFPVAGDVKRAQRMPSISAPSAGKCLLAEVGPWFARSPIAFAVVDGSIRLPVVRDLSAQAEPDENRSGQVQNSRSAGYPVWITTAAQSGQTTDGRWILMADETVQLSAGLSIDDDSGTTAIVGWNAAATATWKPSFTRWGMYRVLLVCRSSESPSRAVERELESNDDPTAGDRTGVADLKIVLDNIEHTLRVPSDHTDFGMSPIDAGKWYVANEGVHSVTVQVSGKAGQASPVGAICAVILMPEFEGAEIAADPDGTIVLHGRDARVWGTKLRYEPAEAKRTLGYWVNASDWAEWQFDVAAAGDYEFEVLQGCGKGHGGSRVQFTLHSTNWEGDQTGDELSAVPGDESNAGRATLRAADGAVDGAATPGETQTGKEARDVNQMSFIVEDTGHFQAFKKRTIGTASFKQPGTYVLRVQPEKIANVAAADIREVRLVPVKQK